MGAYIAAKLAISLTLIVSQFGALSPGVRHDDTPRVEGSATAKTFGVTSTVKVESKAKVGSSRANRGGPPAPQGKAKTSTHSSPKWTATSNNEYFMGSKIAVGGWNYGAENPCEATPNLIPVAVTEVSEPIEGRPSTVRLVGTACEEVAVAAAVIAAPRPVVVTTEMFASIDLRQRRTECTCHDVGEQIPAFVVGVPAVFWQDAEPEVVTTTLQGQVVELRATPVAWVMEWGDGSVPLRSTVPGVKWEVNPREKHPSTVAGSLWHVWEHRGYYDLKQTIDYKGEFRVNGGAWQTIAGTVTKPGPSTKVKIRSFIALEVDEDY